ncbi:MAG: ABC transporter ATP-binding protein/permease [Gemmatimonadetes bacterium]|nr:ABC transporter ATP-binding protein/permease [Gemmatimonadota bacterium]
MLRFFITSVGRSALSLLTILLIRDYLSALFGQSPDAAPGGTILGPSAGLWLIAGVLVAAYVGASLLNYDNLVVQQRIVKVVELGLMERLIRHLLGLSVPFFDRQSHGDIIQAVRQDVSELRAAIVAMARLILEVVVALGLFIAALWLSPILTFWALIVLPLAVYPIFRLARGILLRSRRVRRRGYVLFDVILQLLRGIRVIKAYRGEQDEARTAVEKARLYFDELIEIVRVRSLAQVVLESLAGLGIVVVVILGGFQVLSGDLTWPALLAFLMAMRTLHGPLNNANQAYVTIRNHGAAIERISELLSVRPEITEAPDALPLERPPARIAFENVSFAYGGNTVLDGLSFEVRAGETLGIAGPSGTGKTTLLNLVARFYDPTAGRVLVDGTDLRQYRLADVYDKLGIVTQEPFLFSASVRDNIRVGRPHAAAADVEAAARAAGIHDEILELSDGYDTTLGSGARPLSTGQAQRINIARALLKNAPILLLDEATSSLDSLTEANVQRAIDRLMTGRTTFIVAHRLSTLRHATRILVLDAGRCVGLGDHAELLRTCALYRWMWETQQIGSHASDGEAAGGARHIEEEVAP